MSLSPTAITARFRGLGSGTVALSIPRKHVALITIGQPQRKNAISPNMMAEFSDAIRALEENVAEVAAEEPSPLVGVVIAGEANTFCSGFDLSAAADSFLEPESPIKFHSVLMHDILSRLRRLPLISVAAVEGNAYGGGAELMTAADLRVVSDSASVRFVQSKMGLTPGWQAATRLTGLVGRGTALRLLASGSPFSGIECHRLGLADEVVPSGSTDGVIQRAVALLESYAGNADPAVIRGLKRAVHAADTLPTDAEKVDAERSVFFEFWGAEPNRIAVEQRKKKEKID